MSDETPAGFDTKNFDTKNLQNRKYKAEDYHVDPAIREENARKNRRCTDLFCAILFATTITAMIGFCIYSYVVGQPAKYMAPINQDGAICGFTNETAGYPRLYLANIKAASLNPTKAFAYGVCVKKCPDHNDVNTTCSPNHQEQCNQYVTYGTWDFMGYCVPIYDEMSPSQQINFDNLASAFKSSNFGGLIFELYMSKWVMLICIGVSMVLAIGYIQLMDWAAVKIAWISVVCVWIGLVLVGVFAYMGKNQALVNSMLYKDGSADQDSIFWYKFTYWTAWIFAGIYAFCAFCKCHALRVSVRIIETAADFYAETKRVIFVPLLFFIIGIIVFTMWCFGLSCVCSIGTITTDSVLMQTKDVERDTMSHIAIAVMIIGMVWFVEFLVAANEFTIICAAVDWYYDATKEERKNRDGTVDPGLEKHADIYIGLGWCFWYNMGTLAFGSFVMTLVDIIRWLFEYVGDKIEEATPNNGCTKCLLNCMRCCIECFDRLMRFINMNAYIYCAIAGTPFCESALNAFLLQLKNAAKFGFVNAVGGMFMFIAKLSIALLTTTVGWLLCKVMVSDSTTGYLVLFLIFLVSYFVAGSFISVFDAASNTMLQCFILDKEIADSQNDFNHDKHVPDNLIRFFEGEMAEHNKVGDKKEDQLQEKLLANDMA